ncbi:hypothetical protein HC256_003738 [Beauveria bassiana]|nr:hypothetical protein HC256_003738 [Beauveria bassiana]
MRVSRLDILHLRARCLRQRLCVPRILAREVHGPKRLLALVVIPREHACAVRRVRPRKKRRYKLVQVLRAQARLFRQHVRLGQLLDHVEDKRVTNHLERRGLAVGRACEVNLGARRHAHEPGPRAVDAHRRAREHGNKLAGFGRGGRAKHGRGDKLGGPREELVRRRLRRVRVDRRALNEELTSDVGLQRRVDGLADGRVIRYAGEDDVGLGHAFDERLYHLRLAGGKLLAQIDSALPRAIVNEKWPIQSNVGAIVTVMSA